MRVAVCGGGLFGCTAAVHLARAGHEVHLFERMPNLMQAASSVNQLRLHRGYHYPRSPETGRECRAGNISFFKEYGSAVITPEKRKHGRQGYAMEREGSKVSASDYLRFCESEGLPFKVRDPNDFPLLNAESIEIVGDVLESSLDFAKLHAAVLGKLKDAAVTVHLNTSATLGLRGRFDVIIVAGYASTNEIALALDAAVEPFQFEVVEKPVVRLPEIFRDVSVGVMDGPFGSLVQFGSTELHLMGHVEHAIHHSASGLEPDVPEHLEGYLNNGIIVNPRHTHFPAFIEAGEKFIPRLAGADHVGSMFTVRAVLPGYEASDERPTLVERLDDQVIRIFSGKLGTCVVASTRALGMIAGEKREAA